MEADKGRVTVVRPARTLFRVFCGKMKWKLYRFLSSSASFIATGAFPKKVIVASTRAERG